MSKSTKLSTYLRINCNVFLSPSSSSSSSGLGKVPYGCTKPISTIATLVRRAVSSVEVPGMIFPVLPPKLDLFLQPLLCGSSFTANISSITSYSAENLHRQRGVPSISWLGVKIYKVNINHISFVSSESPNGHWIITNGQTCHWSFSRKRVRPSFLYHFSFTYDCFIF